jgi:hypothetical protein
MKIRTKILLSSFVLLAGLCLQACDTAGDFDDPDVDYFVKYYGTSLGNQSGVDMVSNSDGTFTIVGTAESGGTSRTYFLKVDALGNTLLDKYLSGPTDVVKDIEPLNDGGYLILSQFTEEGTENTDIKILRVDGDGNKADSVVHGTVTDIGQGMVSFNDHPRKMEILKSGKIIVSGSSDNVEDNGSQNPDLADYMSFGFNADLTLDTNWQFNLIDYGADDDFDVLVDAVEGKNEVGADAVFSIGFTTSELGVNPNRDMVLCYMVHKSDGTFDDGTSVPNLASGADTQIAEVISEESSINPGFFFVGSTFLSSGKTELFFGKLREQLNFDQPNDVQFLNRLVPPGANSIRGVSACKSNIAPEGYLIVANDTKPTGSSDIIALKVDLSGQLVWSSRLGSDQGDDAVAKVIELPDGRVLILGTTELGDNQRKLSLIKMNSSGQLLK